MDDNFNDQAGADSTKSAASQVVDPIKHIAKPTICLERELEYIVFISGSKLRPYKPDGADIYRGMEHWQAYDRGIERRAGLEFAIEAIKEKYEREFGRDINEDVRVYMSGLTLEHRHHYKENDDASPS